jgi:superfamily II DNA or RNA helicase
MAHRGVKTAVIIDKTTLIKQWSDEVAKHLNVPTARIGVVQGKRWVWEDHDIVIMSIHTLIRNKDKIPKGFYEAFGLVVFDECHHLAAKTFKTICHQFSGERLGLSATPNREDGLEDIFKNHLGEIIYSRVDQELIPEVIFQKTDVPAHISEEREALDRTGEVNHRRLCRLLGKQHNRTQLALSWLQTLLTQGHHILCLSHSVDNVTEFATQATEFLGVHVGVACGDVRADERVSEIENNKVSVGTIDIASEALNVPSLSALLILTPFGAGQHGNTLQQTLGRIQRKYEGKPAPVCVFLYDHNVGLCRGLINQVKRALRRMDMKYDTREHTVGEHT